MDGVGSEKDCVGGCVCARVPVDSGQWGGLPMALPTCKVWGSLRCCTQCTGYLTGGHFIMTGQPDRCSSPKKHPLLISAARHLPTS